MSTKSIKRFKVAGFPLIISIMERLGLRDLLLKYFDNHGNSKFHTVDTLIIVICNIVTGRIPLYELKEWVANIHPSCFSLNEIDLDIFNDDRFAKAIEKACYIYRARII